mgnify:CR=1 FL=1
MAKYKVKHTSIMHNSKLYKEGSTIELSDEQAKRLADFVELVESTSAPTSSQTQTAKNSTSQPVTTTDNTQTTPSTNKSKTKNGGKSSGK